ncbi:MAG: hypothetical protein QX199_11605 [Methylococcaceae bacterium]
MAAKKKSVFYHTRWNKVGINEERAAEILGVTVKQVQEWDENEGPDLAIRLLIIWDRKHIGIPGWDGWSFSRGTLRYKNQQWRPDNIIYGRIAIDRADKAESELRKLKGIKGIF